MKDELCDVGRRSPSQEQTMNQHHRQKFPNAREKELDVCVPKLVKTEFHWATMHCAII